MKKAIFTIVGIVILLGTGGVWLYARPQAAPALPQIRAPKRQPILQSQPATTSRAILRSFTVALQIGPTSTPTIGPVTATPSIIVLNASAAVRVSAQIIDASLIPGSVNLLRLDAPGTQPTILGVMTDTGNGIYVLQPVFNEPTPGQIQLEVSAAFRGRLNRVVSTPINISVWPVPSRSFVSSNLGITISYPADWSTITETSKSVIFHNVTNPSSVSALASFQVRYMPRANPGLLPISDWFAGFSAHLSSPPGPVTLAFPNGHPAIQIEGGHIVPETILYVSRGPDVFEVAFKSGDPFPGEYQGMLNSLTF